MGYYEPGIEDAPLVVPADRHQPALQPLLELSREESGDDLRRTFDGQHTERVDEADAPWYGS